MKIEIVIFLAAFFVFAILFTLVVLKKKAKGANEEYNSPYRYLYSKLEYKIIANQSARAGKFNSPFIPNDNIVETLQSGSSIIGTENMFEKVGDCNERPIW